MVLEGLTKQALGCMLYKFNHIGGSMRTLIVVLLASTFLAGCIAVPAHQHVPAGSTTVYVPVQTYPVYPVYPVVPMYYGPAWSVCINCRRGHWRW